MPFYLDECVLRLESSPAIVKPRGRLRHESEEASLIWNEQFPEVKVPPSPRVMQSRTDSAHDYMTQSIKDLHSRSISVIRDRRSFGERRTAVSCVRICAVKAYNVGDPRKRTLRVLLLLVARTAVRSSATENKNYLTRRAAKRPPGLAAAAAIW